MQKSFISTVAGLLLACVPALSLAGYADDRAEIMNLSNRYMVAVDAVTSRPSCRPGLMTAC
jgi:hypothetical protein